MTNLIVCRPVKRDSIVLMYITTWESHGFGNQIFGCDKVH